MKQIPETLKKYGGILGKGAIINVTPAIAQGALIELLKKENVGTVTEWVQSNRSLWDSLGIQNQERLHRLTKMGNIDWLTAEWAIDSIRKDLPAITSLFLGWKKAHNWLERQVVIIKSELGE